MIRCKPALLAAAVFSASTAWGQIATDGSVGPRQSFSGITITIPNTVGRWVNGNLFHSFQTFNVNGGQSVTFQPTPITIETPAMNNIISRVTGGTPTTIQGTLRSTGQGVNLYLINPSGMVIGFDANIDVNGSFYASTAHYLRSADGSKFESRGPGVSLTFTTPNGFGFDSSTVAPITIQGGLLRVRDGATLGIVGGPLTIGHASQGVTMLALGGEVMLVGAASPGVVEYGPQGNTLNGFGALSDVRLQSGVIVNVIEGAGRTGGGSAYIRGNDVTLDRVTIAGRTTFGNGRGFDIGASGDLTINGASVETTTIGAGDSGRIRLSGNNITLSNGAVIDTSCDPGCTAGNGGFLEVRANDRLFIDGTAGTTAIVSNSLGGGRTGEIDITARNVTMEGAAFIQGIGERGGDATAIRIHADDIQLRGGAQVDASSRGTGQGGRISVNGNGVILIDGTRPDPAGSTLRLPSGFFSNTSGGGNAGGIAISTRTLEIVAGGEISSTAFRGSAGHGGSIAVSANEAIRVSGSDATGKPSAIVTNSFASGNAGEISLSAPTIRIADNARVQSQSEGDGHAGRIAISGHDFEVLSQGQVSSDARAAGDAGTVEVNLTGTLRVSGNGSGIFAKTYASATGGDVLVEADKIVLTDTGGLVATTSGSGRAGRIRAHARDSIRLESGGLIAAGTIKEFVGTGLSGDSGSVDVRADRDISMSGGSTIQTLTNDSGAAGAVFVQAGRALVMAGGSTISSEAAASGPAGNVQVRSEGTISLGEASRVTTQTRATSPAGTVTLFGRGNVEMTSGAVVSSETTGSGRAGSVEARSDAVISVGQGARISTSTTSAGNAGTVTVSGGTGIDVHSNGAVVSETSGSGGGGTVNVRSDGTVTVRTGGRISTSASGAGDAGNVDVRSAGTLAIIDAGRITTEAAFSDGGNIHIESPRAFMDGGRITTAVGTGFGDGGNMEIRVPTLVMNDSVISANAFGGDGGNIHIGTQTFFKSANSSVTASSTLGVDGTISLDSPAIDPAGQLLPPSPAFVDAGAVLAGRCGSRLAGRASSLVIVPRGDVAGDLHASFDRAIRDPWYTTNALTCEPSPRSF